MVNIKQIRKMGLDTINGLLKEDMLDGGTTVNNMVLVYSLMKIKSK
jgi:hypothetical protein